ncbi:hypothetical protein [Arthrobacter sp. Z4-13]
MKRAITTLGVLSLVALAAAAPAVADRGSDHDKVIICHAGKGSKSGHFTANSVSVPSMSGHDEHGADIIPPNNGMKYGQNWDDVGRAIHANGCVVPPVVVPPVDVPPVDVPPVDVPPVVVPPVDVPPVDVPPAATPVVVPEQPVAVPEQPAAVQPQANGPQAAAAAPAAGATGNESLGTNQGYNAQTAVGGSDGAPSWLAGLGALLTAGAAVAFRRKSRSLPLAG